MYGKGFLTHLGKDRFEVSNVGVGRNFKKIQIKLLKKDMQDILKKYGRDNTGNKDEIIRKFVEFAKKVPKLFNPRPQAQPQAQPEFIPLEEAMPQIQSKPKIIPFTRLEEAVPQFQSKNIKIKRKLPPLISAREEELYKLKIPELKQMIKEKKMKPGNKEQMIKQILKSENIEEGVRWSDTWLYKDLVRQHDINEATGQLLDNSPSIENVERQIKFLENRLKNTEFLSGTDGRTKKRRLQDSLELYKNKLQEIKTLMSRDLQKEYDANIKKREEKSKRFDEARKQERLQAEFIPLEEAMPQFQSKNIKIQPKPKATAVVYRSITRPRVIQPEPKPEPKPAPKKPKEIKPNFKSNNAFDILGVDENTTEKDIKTRYRELSRINHPDKLGNADIQALLNRAYKEIMERQDILSVAREKRAKEQEKFNLIDKKKLDDDFKKSLKIITDSKAKGKTNLKKQLKFFKTYRANKFAANVQIQMRRDYDAFRQALIDNGLQEVVDLADTLFFMRDML